MSSQDEPGLSMQKDLNHRCFFFRQALMILTALVLVPVPAFAYLDPSTGSMLISAIVGLFASLVLAIKTYWYRIRTFFKSKPDKSDTEDKAV